MTAGRSAAAGRARGGLARNEKQGKDRQIGAKADVLPVLNDQFKFPQQHGAERHQPCQKEKRARRLIEQQAYKI